MVALMRRQSGLLESLLVPCRYDLKYSIHITLHYHTTLRATPTQLVFGRDAILNIRHKADWNYIKNQKQKLINKNNEREIPREGNTSIE